MSDLVVSTAFKAQDRVTKSFGNMSKGADKFGRKASMAFRKASRSGRDFQSVTKGILAAGAVQRGLGLVEQGIGSVVRQFIDFDQATTGAAVRFKDIGPGAKNFAEQLKLIKDRARLAGAETEFTAAQAGAGLDFLARAGFKSAEAMGSLNSMIALSTATGEDFAQVADFSSDLLGAFGLAVDDTGQKIKNLNHLNDVLVKTANSANVTVEDMFETMKVGAPIAVKFGASLEDVAAMTALMGNMGIKGSLGATAIKNIFTRLAAPTKEVTKALGKLGLTQQDLIDKNGKFKDISNTMELIGDRIKDLPQAKQLGVLSGIFGARALAGGANIVDAISNIKEFTKILKESKGTAEATAEILRKTLGNRLKTLGSAATEAGFKFLSAFDKNGKDAITRLTNAVRQFDMTPIIESAEKILKVFKIMLPILINSGPALLDMAGGMALYFAAIKIGAIWSFVSAIG
ncbi:phage tail tape measure protein, partial [Candidatus Babeliales bacterium]|nr:phage tail tape measure protein [Candidatus Babeliales bacterium]